MLVCLEKYPVGEINFLLKIKQIIIYVSNSYILGRENEASQEIVICLKDAEKEKSIYSSLKINDGEELIKKIDEISNLSVIWKASNKYEAIAKYGAPDGLELGFMQKGSNQNFFIRISKAQDTISYSDLSIKDLHSIKINIEKAISAIKQIGNRI